MKRRNVIVLDQQLLPSQPRLPSFSLHTSFTAHSLAFCGESVSVFQNVCAQEVAPSVLLKGQTIESVNQCRHKEDNYGGAGTKRNLARCSHVLLKALCHENSHSDPLLAAVHRICCVPPSPSLTTSRSRCAAEADIPHFFARPGSGHPDKKAAGAGPHQLRK